MNSNDNQRIWQELQVKATNYPTKALLYNAMLILKEQEHRIQMNQGMLDGGLWSRHSWKRTNE